MKHLRNKMAVGATLVSLGGLTAVAMSQGPAKRRASTAAPAADVRTVTVEQTVHRYRHVGLGDGAHGSATQTAAVHVGWAKAAAVATRASGSHAAATSGAGAVSRSQVKSYASGAKGGGRHSTAGSGHANGAPTTKSSGSKAERKPVGSGTSSEGPMTKPSGAGASEGSGGSTPTSPPTTRSSGASGSGGGGTGTETTPTPPPTTKPSGTTGGGTGEGGKTEGQEGREHEHDD